MTSVLTHGKYRQRKDLSASSIPSLVSLEEESHGDEVEKKPTKPPRRSSLSIGLLGGRNNYDKGNKRRSSIAVAFLGRHNKNKDASYEVAVISEKRDSSQSTSPYQSGDSLADERRRSETNIDDNDKHNDDGMDDDDDDDADYEMVSPNGTGDSVSTGIEVTDESKSQKPPSGSGGGGGGEKDKRRRSSWQTQKERRRRQGMPSSSADEPSRQGSFGEPQYNREKRPSWWNIFGSDKQRARRASQDVGIVSRTSDNTVPYQRSKSRSVDHGLAAPFDLESLRSKVEGRFESVDRLSKDGDKKKSSLPSIATTTYTVGNRDTLTSVAARFDTTPSELSHLNRLASSFIYPGQQLLVPDKSATADIDGDGKSDKSSPIDNIRKQSSDDIPIEEKELLDGLRPASPKPGHIERVASPNATGEEDLVITQRFLKINVRHITDGQGVVGGVLLVTPNAVMFDPNVSDPLVIEHGPESYGVIAPMELVVNAAIFHDIAHMRVGGEASTTEKVEIYYPKALCGKCENSHSPGKDSLLVKDETFPELGLGSVETCDDQESVCSSNGRDGDAFPKAFERDLVTPTNIQGIKKTHADSVDTSAVDKQLTSVSYETSTTTTTIATTDKVDDVASALKSIAIADDASGLNVNKENKSLEERRKSLLDHHWAVPSKDRSLEDESTDSASGQDTQDASLSPAVVALPQPASIAAVVADGQQLTKSSCHDSGIDIRDPNSLPIVQPIPTKKIYSDADIVLSSDWVPPLTIAPTQLTDSPMTNKLVAKAAVQVLNVDAGGRKKTSSVSFSIEDNEQHSFSSDKTVDTKKTKMLKRLSHPLTWVEGLTGEGGAKPNESTESAPNTGDSSQSVFSKVFSRRSSIGTFIRPHATEGSNAAAAAPTKAGKAPPPKLDYRSMVSIDDMPELFVSFDKLIPRPARACPDPPLYLRLRMGRPIGKAIPLPTSVMSYGKNKLRPEYWFSIPKNRVDELYRFLNSWVSHLYGDLDEEQIAVRGFELIQHDTEFIKGVAVRDGRLGSDGEDISELTRESWEVLSMSTDDYRKATLFATGSFDQDFPIPDLIGQTEILTEEHREKLCAHLPARAEGYSWSLAFSTSQHGFSLNSLYRKMQRLESPILIVIQDTDNNVFGALTSCSLHVSDHFYGTGESLLYKFNPTFKVFHWTGENLYLIKGNPESLSIGAGDGKFGLWLDGDLNQGRSQKCSTYGNEALAPQEDFVVKTLECWAFV